MKLEEFWNVILITNIELALGSVMELIPSLTALGNHFPAQWLKPQVSQV